MINITKIISKDFIKISSNNKITIVNFKIRDESSNYKKNENNNNNLENSNSNISRNSNIKLGSSNISNKNGNNSNSNNCYYKNYLVINRKNLCEISLSKRQR